MRDQLPERVAPLVRSTREVICWLPAWSATCASESAATTPSSLPSPSATTAEASNDPAVGANPWLVVGTGLAFVGAVIIGDRLALRRASRRPPPVGGE
jgi:hypothetical protein